jgi:hypothetical protein
MTLQLAELTLRNTNLQVQHRLGWGTTHPCPFPRGAVRLLDGIRSTRMDGAAKDGLGGNGDDGQQE